MNSSLTYMKCSSENGVLISLIQLLFQLLFPLSVCLSVCLSVSVCLCLCRSVCLCLSVCLSTDNCNLLVEPISIPIALRNTSTNEFNLLLDWMKPIQRTLTHIMTQPYVIIGHIAQHRRIQYS